MKMLWRPNSKNRKTGDIPQGYVGTTREETERSCEDCPMRKGGCYHWKGRPIAAQSSMQRVAATRPEEYELENALQGSRRSARYVRGAVGGDPWVFSRETVQGWVKSIREHGLRGLLLYTHFAADKGSHLKGLAMASVHSLEEAEARIEEGWRVAMVAEGFRTPDSKRRELSHLPVWAGEKFIRPNGQAGIVCPAQVGRGFNCNNCGLCDPAKEANPLIVFLRH